MTEQQRLQRERLRWHCRRALLELDLVFAKFWQDNDTLEEETAAAFERLLAMEDHDLWDLICKRTPAPPGCDSHMQQLVARLRECKPATASTRS